MTLTRFERWPPFSSEIDADIFVIDFAVSEQESDGLAERLRVEVSELVGWHFLLVKKIQS